MANIKERLAKDGTKRFTCDIRLKGYPPQRATFKRLTDAKKWVQDTESAIREGRHFKTVEAKKHTVADLINRYCTEYLPNNKDRTYSEREQKERVQKLGWWNEKIGYLVLADVTPQLISEHLDAMTQSNATATKYLKNLSHAFSIAVKKYGWITDNPILKVTTPQQPSGRVRFLDDNERAKLLAACKESPNKMLYVCVVLALATGMRQGELMGLQWRDVDLKNGVAILHETKNGERRRVPLSGLGLELLRDYAKIIRIDTPLLFPSPTKPQQPIDLKKSWLNALKKAEIEDFHWHDLRHCTASYLAMDGASLAEIAEVLGHKTLSMVKRYAHLSDGHVSNVVASMNHKIFGGVA
ncbi:MAG: site-specific integrase [Methylococcales bacterium]|nr:site-specific integrase [Methylococcales bacterium]